MNSSIPRVLYGDRFVTTEDIKTTGAVVWAAPYTGGFDCIIPKGTTLVALYDLVDGATAFLCVPENYKEFEKQFVPASDRFQLKYSGYHFGFYLVDIGNRLELISRATSKERHKYEYKLKLRRLFTETPLQWLILPLIYAFILLTLPIKPFVVWFRTRRLTLARQAEEESDQRS